MLRAGEVASHLVVALAPGSRVYNPPAAAVRGRERLTGNYRSGRMRPVCQAAFGSGTAAIVPEVVS